MALEVQYVSCQELHNPSFTPYVVSSQSDVSPDCECHEFGAIAAPDMEHVLSSASILALGEILSDPGPYLESVQGEGSDTSPERRPPQLKASNGHYVEPPVSLVISAPLVEACPSPSSQTDDIPGSYGVFIPPESPSTLRCPNEASQEIAREMQDVLTRSGSHDVHSMPVIEGEHEAAARPPTESTMMHDEPSILDQDDDVQFILSVTRKRKKKRTRQDHLPGDPSKDASPAISKDAAKNISKDAGQGATLGPQTAGLELTASLSLPGPSPVMINSQDHSSIPSTAPGSLLATGPPSAASVSKTRNQTTRKRKRTQDTNLTATLQIFGSTDANTGLVSVQTAFLNRNLQSSRSACPSGQIPGTQPANKIQFAAGFGVGCPPHGLGPISEQTKTSFVQTQMPSLAGPVTGMTQTSLTSTSMSDSLRRRPSLYAIPQWQVFPPGSGLAMQAVSANASRSAYHNPHVSSDNILPGVFPVMLPVAGAGNVTPIGNTPSGHFAQSATSQVRNLQPPTGHPVGVTASQPVLSKQSYPPNMLVDIAQTCQDNFPFALIAKRHNQSIQKVFDTFSAIIQLPLLRSAVDSRRPGKLGSLRMKEFRTMKKGASQVSKGRNVGKKQLKKAEGNGIAEV